MVEMMIRKQMKRCKSDEVKQIMRGRELRSGGRLIMHPGVRSVD